MRVETTTRTLYTFEELDEQAQGRALDAMRDLVGRRWDGSDTERIEEAIVYALAEQLKTPGWDTYGEGDFPGIDGIEIVEWDVDRVNLAIKGTLTRDNAPALPWVDGMDAVTMHPRSPFGNEGDGVDWDNELPDEETEDERTARESGERAAEADIEQAVSDAMHEAIFAGRREYEYMFSDEAIREDIEANVHEFTADGELA